MSFGKKTIATILVVIIGLSLLVGAVSASGNNPLSKILELITGINAEVNTVETKMDALNFTRLITLYEGKQTWSEPASGYVPGTKIQSSDPVLFTVSVHIIMNSAGENEDMISIGSYTKTPSPSYPFEGLMENRRWTAENSDLYEQNDYWETITFPATQMEIYFYTDTSMHIQWRVMVTGNAGTVTTVLN